MAQQVETPYIINLYNIYSIRNICSKMQKEELTTSSILLFYFIRLVILS